MRGATLALAGLVACGFDTSGVGSSGADGVGSQETSGTADPTTTADPATSSSSADTTSGPTTSTTTSEADVTSTGAGESSGDGSTTGFDACSICDADATCTVDNGVAQCTCPEGSQGDGLVCDTVPALAQLRVELPCTVDLGDNCTTGNDADAEAVMVGEPGVVYAVELRIRAIVELKYYAGGGVPDGNWLEGGTFGFDGDAAATIEVSDPPQTFRLNATPEVGGSGPVLLDYVRTIPVATGATVRLVISSIDFVQIENPGLVIPEVPPAEAFDGQLVQIDVEMITPP